MDMDSDNNYKGSHSADKNILLQKKIITSIKNELFLPVNGSQGIFQQLEHMQSLVFILIGEKIAGLCNQIFFFCSFPLTAHTPKISFIFLFFCCQVCAYQI